MMSRCEACDTVATMAAAATDCRSSGRIISRLRTVNSSGMRRSARSCTTLMVGQGEASGTM